MAHLASAGARGRTGIAAGVVACGLLTFVAAQGRNPSEAPSIAGVQSVLSTMPPLEESSGGQQRYISAVDVDGSGTIYAIQRQVKNPITVIAPDGKVIASWGEGMFDLPHGIRVDPEGNVWATDAGPRSRVYEFTRSGNLLLELDLTRYPPKHPNTERFVADETFKGATDVAVARNGHIYVSDGYGNARVVEFDAAGAFVREWGEPGKGPGQFRLPHGIAIGADGNVYVADRENGRVQRFTADGRYVGEWSYGNQLYSLDFGSRGDVYMGYRDATSRGLDGWVLKADAMTGRVIGRFQGPVHFVALAPSGAVMGGTTTGNVQVFTPAP
jgi:DNA-binding beta-propeller fold protein YncE